MWPTGLHWTSKAPRRVPPVSKISSKELLHTALAGFLFLGILLTSAPRLAYHDFMPADDLFGKESETAAIMSRLKESKTRDEASSIISNQAGGRSSEESAEERAFRNQPLAARMRPRDLSEFA